MRPSYRGSKSYLWLSFWFAWIVVFLLTAGSLRGVPHIVDMAAIAIPSMVAIIVGNLSVHRGFGSLDFLNTKRSSTRKSQKQSATAVRSMEQ
ncbi:hypothetical protein [Bartonella sp. CB60]|uniref:hypothetical protein n=1 Tax=Bartonella sp. CB60 TaxID=3113619 RepID=UPI00300DE4B9